MASWQQPGDAAFLLSVLSDGQWHTHDEILAASFRERGVGLTIHSRAATLRERGHNVLCDTSGRRNGRVVSRYRLTSSAASPQSNEPVTHDHAVGREVAAEDVGATSTGGSLSDPLPDGSPVQLSLGLPGYALRKDVAA